MKGIWNLIVYPLMNWIKYMKLDGCLRKKKNQKISVKTQLSHPWEQAGNVSITVLAFMYLRYLCISLNMTRPCCRLQRLNHINSFSESSYVYYFNAKIFGQVWKIYCVFYFEPEWHLRLTSKCISYIIVIYFKSFSFRVIRTGTN